MKLSDKSRKAREYFGEFLLNSRETSDMSSLDVAFVADVTMQTVHYWEVGYCFAQTLVSLKRLAFLFTDTAATLKKIVRADKVKPSKKEWDDFQRLVYMGEFHPPDDHYLPTHQTHGDRRDDEYRWAFGRYLRDRRIEQEIIAASLAAALGVFASNYSRWEAGLSLPQEITVLGLLDKLYGDTFDVIFNLCRDHGIKLRADERRDVVERIREVRSSSRYEKSDAWRKHHAKLLHYQCSYRSDHKKRKGSLTESNARALGILKRSGVLTANAFARLMWPSSPVLKADYVADTGFGGKISGGALVDRTGRIYLERLRKRKLVKKTGDKYTLSAKGKRKSE